MKIPCYSGLLQNRGRWRTPLVAIFPGFALPAVIGETVQLVFQCLILF